MSAAAAWERPWKPPKCFIYKLQSDSWKTWVYTCRPSKFNENHSFAFVGNVKWTLKFHGFLTFLWIPNTRKNKENKKSHFGTRISTVLSSWAPPLHTIFHWNLERNSLRTHLRKTCLFRNIAKTNEIATFWPPRINVKTTCFFVFYENSIASKYLWKIIKKHDISEYHLKPMK